MGNRDNNGSRDLQEEYWCSHKGMKSATCNIPYVFRCVLGIILQTGTRNPHLSIFILSFPSNTHSHCTHTHTKLIIIDRQDHKNSWWDFRLKLHQLPFNCFPFLSTHTHTGRHTHPETVQSLKSLTVEMPIRYQITGKLHTHTVHAHGLIHVYGHSQSVKLQFVHPQQPESK